MADHSQAGNIPDFERHCPVCGSESVDLIIGDGSIPVATKRDRSVVTIKARVFVCRRCGFLMSHAKDKGEQPDE